MKKIIFFSLIILFFIKTQNVFSDIGTFTVDNIKVTGKITDQNYRNKYLRVGLRNAFEKLIISIIGKENQKELLSTDSNTIKSLTSHYRITEEEILENEYNLQLSVTFDRDLVSRFLLNKNISYSEIKKLEMIIYPIMIKNSQLAVFSQNKFFEEWNNEEYFENISFILPVENLDDIDFVKRNLNKLEEIDLSRLVDNYEIKNSTILILRYDEKILNVFLKTNLEGVKKSKKIDFRLEDLENKQVTNNIIRNLQYYINELWKEENLIDIAAPSYLTINTKMKDLASLKKVIDKIKNISLINNYSVEELDNNSAKIKIKFFGKIKNLQNSLIDNGFDFKISNNEWIVQIAS